MLKLLQSIFRQRPEATGGYDEKLLQLAVERVVDGTDTRLRALSGYRRKLQPAVMKALDYTIELVDSLSPPVILSPEHFRRKELVRSFFASPKHIQEFLTRSLTLQEYLDKRTGLDPEQIHGLLVLNRVERSVFGMELAGEMFRRDVAQVSVSFSKPRLSALKSEEPKSRFEIKKDVFDYFIELALKDIVSTRQERREARQRQELLQRKQRTLKSGNWGMEALLAGETENLTDIDKTEEELDRLESELQQRDTSPLTLDNQLESIINSLNACRERLWHEPLELKLDRMGIKAEPDDKDAITLQLNEYCSAEGQRVVAQPVFIPFSEIPVRPDLLADMDRYL